MMQWDEISKKLDAPFPLSDIEFRIGNTNADKTKGLLLAYIAARAIQRRLDEAVGKHNWMQEYRRLEAEKGNICTLSIWDDTKQDWIEKSDGAGDTDFEAFKGGLSDAFKRAASAGWGIGRYLYELPSWWVAIEQRGKSYYPAKGEEERVQREFPTWALPEAAPPKPELTPLEVQEAKFSKHPTGKAWGREGLILLLSLARPGVAPIIAANDKAVIKFLDDSLAGTRTLADIFLAAVKKLPAENADALMKKLEDAGVILPPAPERNYLEHLDKLAKFYVEAR